MKFYDTLEMRSEGNSPPPKKKMENQELVSPSRHCFSTPVNFSQRFLNNEQCDNTGAFPIPDVAPADFYLLPRLKSTLQGRRFCDAIDIIRNATEELKRLSRNGTIPTALQSLAEVFSFTRGLF